MYTVTYYKVANRWFLDYPEFQDQGGDPDDLERIGAFYDFLELAAQAQSSVVFLMSPDAFEGADVMNLTGSSGGNTGGYYLLESFEGKPVNLELWMNVVLYYREEVLPQNIYLKRIEGEVSTS